MTVRMIFAGLAIVCLTSVVFAENILPDEAAFEEGKDLPAVWKAHKDRPWERKGFTIKTEGERTFASTSTAVSNVSVSMDVDPAWKTLTLSIDVRVKDLKKGQNNWDVPGVELDYLGEDGKSLLTWEKTNWLSEDTDWKTLTRDYPVPDGAKTLLCRIYYKAQGGTADFGNPEVTVKE